MKVEVLSKESIKPSSPTPHHLRIFKLSFLVDNCKSTIEACCQDLKSSLSETLTRYYTLAGRIKGDVIECGDDGVDYTEAKVHNISGGMSQIIQDSNIHILKQFLPCGPHGPESGSGTNNYKVLLSIQINVVDHQEDYFGGVVIGICIYHQISDMSSLTAFINDWAASSRGVPIEQIEGPRFDILPSLFPPRDLMGYIQGGGFTGEEIVTKKFLFEGSKIDELKKMHIMRNNTSIDDETDNESPTRVEAVSAFIWRRFIDTDQALKVSNGAPSVKMYGAVHAVNMRTRMIPPLPSNSFGNMYGKSMALSDFRNARGEDSNTLDQCHENPNLVIKVRKAIQKIDADYVKKLQTTDLFLETMKNFWAAQTVKLIFSSWCRFPIYEADFGWGKPMWVTTCAFPYKNFIVLMDTKSGDGIEAWINMTKENMAEFERDEELLHFLSWSPF
ncbi:hypothetical protein MKX01_035979 [Papaver californicum]|nr:hypothetical protein MKX01_035979 [Papaver californicum]